MHSFADLLCQEQETVKRLCSIRGAEMEVDRWFQNHVPLVGTEDEAPTKAGLCFSLHLPASHQTQKWHFNSSRHPWAKCSKRNCTRSTQGHYAKEMMSAHSGWPWGLQQRAMWGSPLSDSWGLRYCWKGATTSQELRLVSTAALPCGTNDTQAKTWAKSRKITKPWGSRWKILVPE